MPSTMMRPTPTATPIGLFSDSVGQVHAGLPDGAGSHLSNLSGGLRISSISATRHRNGCGNGRKGCNARSCIILGTGRDSTACRGQRPGAGRSRFVARLESAPMKSKAVRLARAAPAAGRRRDRGRVARPRRSARAGEGGGHLPFRCALPRGRRHARTTRSRSATKSPASSTASAPASRRIASGDRVCLHYLVTCGDCSDCRAGREQFCATGQMIGKDRDGGYAELSGSRRRNAHPLPDFVPFEQGAILMCSSATALHALRKARVGAGDTVAVFGIGGLGVSAIQLARALGAIRRLRRRRQSREARAGAAPSRRARRRPGRRSRAGDPRGDRRARRRRRARADRLRAHHGAGRRGARAAGARGARRPHAGTHVHLALPRRPEPRGRDHRRVRPPRFGDRRADDVHRSAASSISPAPSPGSCRSMRRRSTACWTTSRRSATMCARSIRP